MLLHDQLYLDDLRAYLERANTPYHAHITEINDGVVTGSLWGALWGFDGIVLLCVSGAMFTPLVSRLTNQLTLNDSISLNP